MYKRVKIKKLGRTRSNRNALIQNQLRSLFAVGKVQTTSTKAKVLLGRAQSMINSMKSVNLNSRKSATQVLGSRDLSDHVIEYAKSNPVVKIMKVGYRDGDNAQVSRVELVGYTAPKKASTKKTAESKKKLNVDTKKSVTAVRKNVARKDSGKKVAKTATVKRERATSRSGL